MAYADVRQHNGFTKWDFVLTPIRSFKSRPSRRTCTGPGLRVRAESNRPTLAEFEQERRLAKAVETLAGMLDGKDDRLKRLTANDIINHVLKHKELAELEQRLEALEDRLSDR